MPRIDVRHALLLAMLLLSAGCRQTKSPPPESGSNAAVQLTGGERLSWTQAANDVSNYRFVVYVDSSVTRELPDAVCKPASPGQYDCTATVPALSAGSHVLEIAATLVKDGQSVPGSRSQPFTVVVAAKGDAGAAK